MKERANQPSHHAADLHKGPTKRLTGILLISLLCLSACENAELKNCLDQQSALWNSAAKDPAANQAYWKGIEQCKQAYP
jgi:hypothetical protein